MVINAIFCEVCGEITFSTSSHDFRRCSCYKTYVDGGFEYFRYGGNNPMTLKLNSDVILKQILEYDYLDGLKGRDKPKGRLHGKYKIYPTSNDEFYKKLIINWKEFSPHYYRYKELGKYIQLQHARKLAKEKGLMR